MTDVCLFLNELASEHSACSKDSCILVEGVCSKQEQKTKKTRCNLLNSLREAILVIDEALDRYGDNLAVSFNGGKDACVVLALLRHCLYRRSCQTANSAPKSSECLLTLSPPSPIPYHLPFTGTSHESSGNISSTIAVDIKAIANSKVTYPTKLNELKVLYFSDPLEFEEVTKFLSSTSTLYDFTYTVYNNGFRDGLNDCVAKAAEKLKNGGGSGCAGVGKEGVERDCEGGTDGELDDLKERDTFAVIMGMRVGDPHSGDASFFQPSSAGW